MRAALLTLAILAAGYARPWRETSDPQTYRSLRDACEQEYGPLFGSGSIEVDRCILRASEARHLKRVVDSSR